MNDRWCVAISVHDFDNGVGDGPHEQVRRSSAVNESEGGEYTTKYNTDGNQQDDGFTTEADGGSASDRS